MTRVEEKSVSHKYHAGAMGRALCGASGNMGGFHVVTLPASEWNALAPAERCSKCVEKIRARKEVRP